jgi:deazaflavin-dependent oxidoreductase (nitroreductase family)
MTAGRDMKAFNAALIEEFRANQGRVGGPFEGRQVLLLTTTGARSGRTFTIPLVYLKDSDRMYIFASKAGSPRNPDWYYNLVANPDVTVEVGTDTIQAKAVVVTGDERDRLYQKQVAEMPQFGTYQESTTRVIPVIELKPTGKG